jgi:hypothetical protein
MARYIDADKFLKDETRRCGCVPLVGSCTTDNESLAYQLAKASTADVVEVKKLTPCDACAYNPPSSLDGKPCTMCPASARMD